MESFAKDRRNKSGRASTCLLCMREKASLFYQINKHKILERLKNERTTVRGTELVRTVTRENIMQFVEISPVSNCWNWMGCRNDNGYGLKTSDGKRVRTHRLSYELFVGPIPSGMIVCHKCDNPPCCNPEHLFVGTHKDNHNDCVSKGRSSLPPPPLVGERNIRAKLTNREVREICELHVSGASNRDIAEKLGLPQRHIFEIISRKSWRSISEPILAANRRPKVGPRKRGAGV